MAKDLKKPLSYEEQLKMLKQHYMEIEDDCFAIDILKRVNYYRLSGYALSFRRDDFPDLYEKGTSFNRIYHLFLFDEELRAMLLRFLLIIEGYLRTQISNCFSLLKCQQPPYDQHYCENIYYRKDRFNDVFNSLIREKDHNSDSLVVKHHEKKYNGKMPLWVIVELLSFSNLSKYYNSMFSSDQEKIAKGVGTSAKVLSNHMHCLSVLRNKCAHGSRIYNISFSPPARLGSPYLRKYNDVRNDELFAYCRVIYLRLPTDEDRTDFVSGLTNIIERFKNYIELEAIGFPDDWNDVISG